MQFSIRTKAEALPSLINSAFSYLFNLPLILIPISSTSLQTSLPALEQPPGWFPRIHFPLSKLQARSSHSPSVAFQCLQAIYKRLNISLVFKVFTLPAHHFSCREATLLHSGRHRSHPSLCEWWLLEYCSTQPVRLNMVAWPLHRTLYSVLKAASLVHHLSSHSEILNIAVSCLLYQLLQYHLHLVNPTCPSDLFRYHLPHEALSFSHHLPSLD